MIPSRYVGLGKTGNVSGFPQGMSSYHSCSESSNCHATALINDGQWTVYQRVASMTRFLLHSPLDMHLHLREGDILSIVAPLSAQAFAGAVIMPNLVPPVDNRVRLERYYAAIRVASDGAVFEPYMTLFFQSYDEATLRDLRTQIIGIKLYPAGVT